MTESQFDEFMALAKSNATSLRVEVRDVGYAVEAAGSDIALAINLLTLAVIACTVALAVIAYLLKG
jgi:hypothetical protein